MTQSAPPRTARHRARSLPPADTRRGRRDCRSNDGILDAEELARASELLDPATLNKFVFGLDASHPKDVPRIVQTLTDNQIFADYGEADRGPDRTGQRPVEATGKIIAAAATISKDIDTNGTYTHQIGQLRAHQTGRPYALEPSLPPADPRVVAAQRAALSGTPPPSAGCSTLVRTDDATEQQLKRARHAAEAAYQAATAAMVAAREERPADEVARLVAAADAATAAAVDATVRACAQQSTRGAQPWLPGARPVCIHLTYPAARREPRRSPTAATPWRRQQQTRSPKRCAKMP